MIYLRDLFEMHSLNLEREREREKERSNNKDEHMFQESHSLSSDELFSCSFSSTSTCGM